jgi:hypothetical protein
VHRERVRTEVFGLGGDAGRDRYDGLLIIHSASRRVRLEMRTAAHALVFPVIRLERLYLADPESFLSWWWAGLLAAGRKKPSSSIPDTCWKSGGCP